MSEVAQDFITPFEPIRARAWPMIEAAFAHMPAALQDLAWEFAQRLARQTAPSGQFEDALKHPAAARVCYLPLWHIDGLLQKGVDIADVEKLQEHLFASAFLGFCAIRIHDDLVDEDKPDVPVDMLLLANILTIEAIAHLQQVFASDSPLWTHHARHWREYTEAVRVDKDRDRSGLRAFEEDDLRHIGNKAALLKTFPLAVALYADQHEQIEDIEAMMDAFNIGIQLSNDIQSVRSDIESGHYTPPLARSALQIDLAPGTHPDQQTLLGSLMLSDALVETHDQALTYFSSSRQAAEDMGLGALVHFINWHIDDLKKSQEKWRGTRVDKEVAQKLLKAQILPLLSGAATAAPLPQQTIDMGALFLRFDKESKEAWEIQRTGVWQRDLLVGDVFGRSIVLETLLELDQADAQQVLDLLEQYRRNGWRYYRDFAALPPDIDDIAQAMRLIQATPWDNAQRAKYLEKPLRWLAANRHDDGSFPVWLTNKIDDQPEEGWIDLGGMECIACEANLLDALADLDDEHVHLWIAPGIQSLLARWQEGGYNSVYYYKPSYAACVLARCFLRLSQLESIDAETRQRLAAAQQAIAAELAQAAPTDALALAARRLVLHHDREQHQHLLDADAALLKEKQSFDGGWERVDFFRCPGRVHQAIGWHSSRLITSALVVRALALRNAP